MKFTLSHLKSFLATDATGEELAAKLTALGLECESFGLPRPDLAPFTVARILEARPHPEADKLQVCTVDAGNGSPPLQIVCGAANARTGLTVALAPVGSRVPGPDMVIKKAKIRGVESCGMLCSASELSLGTDGEGIMELSSDLIPGTPFVNAAGLNDPVFEINVTPDRGDCLSVLGVARDLAASGAGELTPPAFHPAEERFDCPVTVSLSEDGACSFYAGVYIRGIDNTGAPPAPIRRRLEAIGARCISPVVDIINDVMYSLGRPMHAFDAARLHEGALTVRPSRAGEVFKGLNGVAYTLPEGVCVVADGLQPHALGGILGGEDSSCRPETREIFLESALFCPRSVAAAGRRLNVTTESRKRFERGTDPALTESALLYAARLIQHYCGGEISRLVRASISEPSARPVVLFRPARVAALTGMEAPREECLAALTRLGFGVTSEQGDERRYAVTVPSWRHDVEREQDLIEEAARMLSYDRIPETPLPPLPKRGSGAMGALPPAKILPARLRRTMAGNGLSETLCWSFISDTQFAAFGEGTTPVRILNPISQEWAVMRPTLIAGLLRTAAENMARGLSEGALCETGQIFTEAKPYGQRAAVAGVRFGLREPLNPFRKAEPVSVFDAKADLLACLAEAGINPDQVKTETTAPSYYHPGRKGSLWLGRDRLGYFGQLHPELLEQEGCPRAQVVAFECDVDALLTYFRPFKAKQPPALSSFQSSERDFCFVMNADLPLGKLTDAIRKAAKDHLEELRLFDLYTGKGIGEGKCSAAYTLRLRPHTAPWTEEQLRAISDAVIEQAGKLGAVLRSDS